MHNIDRTLSEFEPEYEAFEADEFEFESDSEDSESVFSEAEEMELAAELLSASNEGELDQFLGGLIKKAAGAVRKAVSSPLGKSLGGFLKGAVKNVLPKVGGIAGGLFGGPVGAAIGGKLTSAATNALGLELEGLSQEDQEFEAARALVRLSGDATKTATMTSPAVEPTAAARNAVISAARKHAPGLVRRSNGAGGSESGGGRSGRWIRRGRKIILIGV
jgi:uncharacterized protein (DUF697 family)